MRHVIWVHVPTVAMSFLPPAFGWTLVLFPVHVVFAEFNIDLACSIVFEADAIAHNLMRMLGLAPAWQQLRLRCHQSNG
jgi:P-type Ca2+ transporter type 2C